MQEVASQIYSNGFYYPDIIFWMLQTQRNVWIQKKIDKMGNFWTKKRFSFSQNYTFDMFLINLHNNK